MIYTHDNRPGPVSILDGPRSETVIKTMSLLNFTPAFAELRDNGNIWGVFESEDGSICATDIWGEVHSNVLREDTTIIEIMPDEEESGFSYPQWFAPLEDFPQDFQEDYHQGKVNRVYMTPSGVSARKKGGDVYDTLIEY
ncbi:MAG: hypothetical protein AAF146_10405 [Bacteroidota bacterium]